MRKMHRIDHHRLDLDRPRLSWPNGQCPQSDKSRNRAAAFMTSGAFTGYFLPAVNLAFLKQATHQGDCQKMLLLKSISLLIHDMHTRLAQKGIIRYISYLRRPPPPPAPLVRHPVPFAPPRPDTQGDRDKNTREGTEKLPVYHKYPARTTVANNTRLSVSTPDADNFRENKPHHLRNLHVLAGSGSKTTAKQSKAMLTRKKTGKRTITKTPTQQLPCRRT